MFEQLAKPENLRLLIITGLILYLALNASVFGVRCYDLYRVTKKFMLSVVTAAKTNRCIEPLHNDDVLTLIDWIDKVKAGLLFVLFGLCGYAIFAYI